MKKWQLSLFISIVASSLITIINNSQNNFNSTNQNNIVYNINIDNQKETLDTRNR